jgi:16S rRNA processing protein RimM
MTSPTKPGRPLPTTVEVGRLVRAHGVTGDALVRPSSDFAARFRKGAELLLCPPGGSPQLVRLAAARRQGELVLVRFEPALTREEVIALQGAVLEVDRAQVPPAKAGTYYHFELLGCRVEDAEEGDLGEVVDVLADGGGLLLEVVDGEREVLVPFVAGFLVAVDIAGRQIRTRLPEGLLAACASRS